VVEEARLEPAKSGLVPVTDGWFVVNVRDAAWVANDSFGVACVFEGSTPVLRENPELEEQRFPQLGFDLRVLRPGEASGMYHAESNQEDFLVLAGECLAIVEGEERRLRAWDFLHCPPGTAHVFVGAGDAPCAIFMTGARAKEREIVYPRSEAAIRHGAGVESETSDPHEAYAPFSHWQPRRPESGDQPWADA
jgi:uncharacterized cupin superfamily protein